MDLGGGKYAAYEEEWLLDGSPSAPSRRTIGRRDITSGTAGVKLTATVTATTVLAVYAVAVQPGDVFDFASFICAVAPTGTIAHSWAAVYTGTGTGAALLAQSADVTTGFALGANKLALGSAVANIGTQGIGQGPSTPALVAAGPAVWGIALYGPGATTGALLDGALGGSLAGEVAVTGQAALAATGTITASAAAPAVLPTMTAVVAPVPYVLLSR
jgi:hypothetical protein